jgi:hypothetical protein
MAELSPAILVQIIWAREAGRFHLVTTVYDSGRVPLDKEKGFVKGKEILSGAEHRLVPTSESVGPRLWDITAESLFWWIAPPNHRYDRNYYHDSSIRTSSRRVCAEVGNTGGVFQGACAVFCIDRSGCESTQSMFRARLRPGAPAGCSRYERSPDSRHYCVASSRVALPACVPPPPWLLP